MSLTDKLLALDATKYKEKKTDTIEIKRLSKLIGEPFNVKVQEVDDNRMQELQAMILKENGKVDYTQVRKVNALLCCDGVIEPNLGDEKLQKHFGAATPKELAEILFKGADLGSVAERITELGNYTDIEDEEIKN